MLTRQQIAQNFISVCEQERSKRGWTQAEMAEYLGVSLSGYKKIISEDTSRIDLYLAHRLHKLTGRLIGDIIGDDNQLISITTLLQDLSPSQLNFVESVVKFEYAYNSLHDGPDSEMISVLVLTGDMFDGMIYDSANVIKVRASADIIHRYGSDLLCGIKITSNHLHPVYHTGDILLISRSPIRDGDTGIFINREDGRAYIRKFHQGTRCRLEPINGFGQTFFVDGDDPADMYKWIKFGHVLSKLR